MKYKSFNILINIAYPKKLVHKRSDLINHISQNI